MAESFPHARYSCIDSAAVSQDVVQVERMELVSPARTKLAAATLMIGGVKVKLSPGMALSVEIKTGKRRVIDYLLSPLKQHASESLKER